MKIALVIERMDTSRGGRETSTAQIAAALARRGHEVTILCQSGALDGEPGVTVRELQSYGWSRASQLTRFAAAVGEATASGRFDIVHAMLPIPGADVYQPRSGTVPAQKEASLRRRGKAMRWLARVTAGCNLRRRRMAQLESRVMADARVTCLAVSRMVAEEFSRYYGRTAKVRVIYNAVEVPAEEEFDRADWRETLRARLGAGDGDAVFVTVATNLALKGAGELIRAFARWRAARRDRSGSRLVVIGQASAGEYERLAHRLGAAEAVTFLPPTRDVFPWYAAADACILLSWYDPCSRVVLEACRWGLPSLTTAFNGASEVLGEGAGIVVSSPREIGAIVAAMDDLADASRRAGRVEACRRQGPALSMDRHVTELLAAYEEIVAARGTT